MASSSPDIDQCIRELAEAVERIAAGDFAVTIPAGDADRLGEALQRLAEALAQRERERQLIQQIAAQVSAGTHLGEILDLVYESFKGVIPYNRIGFSLIDPDGETVRAHWARSDQPVVHLKQNYALKLSETSLGDVLASGRPRILNDLAAYYEQHPASESTLLILKEGLCSSLTCPLIADGTPIGFMFFSSVEPDAYSETHVRTFEAIAGQLALAVEKGRLISELAAQKEAAEEQNRRLRELDDLKNRFIGMAAHDLRSPTATIQVAANYLLDAEMMVDEEERRTFLSTIVMQTTYMIQLIDDLLDVSRIESGLLELHPELIALGEFLAEAVRWHASVARAKNTAVLLESAPEAMVEADPVRLRQVIDNLISNAVKYSPADSTVTVRVVQEGPRWRISVQDEGPGIAADERDRLFQYFARLSARPTGGEKSTGLGLAITRRVVEAHGGTIGVASAPGAGSTFWFTLPAGDAL